MEEDGKIERWLSRTWAALAGGFRFRKHEQFNIDEMLEVLPPTDKTITMAQLAALDHMRRYHWGRIVKFTINKNNSLPLVGHPQIFCLATAVSRFGKSRVTAKIMVFEGYISSLSFSKDPREFKHADLKLVRAKPGGKDSTVAQEIHRTEHGDDDDDQ